MEVRNQVEGPRIVRRRRIKGAAIPETFHRWMELTRYPNIMQNILSRLPVYKVAQFRRVCRTWNAALSSSDFTSLLRLNSPEISWFVVNLKSVQGVDVLAAYSYSAKVWFKLPLAFLEADDEDAEDGDALDDFALACSGRFALACALSL